MARPNPAEPSRSNVPSAPLTLREAKELIRSRFSFYVTFFFQYSVYYNESAIADTEDLGYDTRIPRRLLPDSNEALPEIRSTFGIRRAAIARKVGARSKSARRPFVCSHNGPAYICDPTSSNLCFGREGRGTPVPRSFVIGRAPLSTFSVSLPCPFDEVSPRVQRENGNGPTHLD